MKVKSIAEAQQNLIELVKQAREEAIGLTDESGNLVALLAGLDEDDLDDLLVQTPAFQAMIARSRDSLRTGAPTSAEDLLKELKAKASREKS